MAVVVNKNTAQYPVSLLGNTGAQSIKHIPAVRVYIKSSDPVSAAPVDTYSLYSFKTLGITPTGWSDLGITNGPGKITYTKTHKAIQTGIDKVTRLVYIDQKTADIEFSLTQMDDLLLTNLGFTGSIAIAGSVMNFQVGQEDVIERALLLVSVNKIDGKEIHWYHPSAKLVTTFENGTEELNVKVNADCVTFTKSGGSTDSLLSVNVFV